MNREQEILAQARKRSEEKNLPYTGALTPKEAFTLLHADPHFVLVDVRSQAELDLVGRIPSTLNIEWAFYPGMVPNQNFAEQLQAQVDKSLTPIFMCRTGGRSHNAAVMAGKLGYDNVYNMMEGFEGEANQLNQRTSINGWKYAGLPWTN